jgi:hypothetical protein
VSAIGGALLALALVTASCSSGSDGADTSKRDALIVEAEPTAETFDPSDPAQLAGTSTDPSKIDVGECFNEYVFRDQADFLQQVTTIVGCDGPHDREAYFTAEYPAGEAESYPLDDTLRRWAESACLDEFEDFVGLEYVLSELEIGAIVPTFEGWTDNADRTVICYVYPDQGGRLRGPVARSGI